VNAESGGRLFNLGTPGGRPSPPTTTGQSPPGARGDVIRLRPLFQGRSTSKRLSASDLFSAARINTDAGSKHLVLDRLGRGVRVAFHDPGRSAGQDASRHTSGNPHQPATDITYEEQRTIALQRAGGTGVSSAAFRGKKHCRKLRSSTHD